MKFFPTHEWLKIIYLVNKEILGSSMKSVCDPVYGKVDQLLAQLNKSKSLHILHLLNSKNNSMLFSEIKRMVNSSSTTVSRRLLELERNGLVSRTVNSTKPTTVSYNLTEQSINLAPIIQSMYDWVVENDYNSNPMSN